MNFLKYISGHFWQFITVIVLLILTGIMLMYFFPFRVATFNNIDVQGEVRAGGTITYQLDLCRYVGKGTKVDPRRFLVPEGKALSSAVQLSSSASLETTGEPGCFKNPPVTIPVEVGTPPGRYQLLIQVQYCIFPGRCIPVEKRSDIFTVDEPSLPDQISLVNRQIENINNVIRMQIPNSGIGNVITPQAVKVPDEPNVVQPQTSVPPQTQATRPQQTVTPQPTAQPENAKNLLNIKSGIIDVQLGLPILKKDK